MQPDTGASFDFSGFLGGLFDTARGVFDTIADIEIGRADVELEKERRKAEQKSIGNGLVATTASEAGGVQTGAAGATGGAVAGFNGTVLLLIGGLGIALLLLRK